MGARMNAENSADALHDIVSVFLEKLPERLLDISKRSEALIKVRWDISEAKSLVIILHSLAGTSKTFGFIELGHCAAAIEFHLEQSITGSFEARDQSALLDMVNKLVDYGQAAKINRTEQPMPMESIRVEPLGTGPIFLVDDCEHHTEFLSVNLRLAGYTVVVFNHLPGQAEALTVESPGAIIMDLAFPEGRLAGAKFVRELKEKYRRDIPVMYVSQHEDMNARLEAVRSGGDVYVVKPLKISSFIEKLNSLVAKSNIKPYRVLIVDDAADLLIYHSKVLSNAGIDVKCVTNPKNVMEALVEHLPDAIILDLYMPHCSGLELAQVLRQHVAYTFLPIIFLSSEDDSDIHFHAKRIGADDFLIKPIKPSHLVSMVVNRAQRYRELQEGLIHESMTGLLTNKAFKRELTRQIAMLNRDAVSVHVCMIDFDKFKDINDEYGHLNGDAVIKRFADLLTLKLRTTDIIGRLGGDEFGIALINADEKVCIDILKKLQADFAKINHPWKGGEFHVSVSIGMTLCTKCDTEISAMERADGALYEAKKNGRNRIVFR
jgi:diguanylate cyclase (GGDEF)-like protein